MDATDTIAYDEMFTHAGHEYRVLCYAGSDIVRLYVRSNGWAQLDSLRGVCTDGVEARANVLKTSVISGYPYF